MRYSRQPRCEACGLLLEGCICARLPEVSLPWRLLLVQHHRESRKPTNTARVLARVVRNCTRLIHARAHERLAAESFGPPDPRPYVLYPADDARTLDRAFVSSLPDETTIILLDGTWRNAGRMARRIPGIQGCPRIKLPPGPGSSWPIRRETREDRLCTFEAAVRLAELSRDSAAARSLRTAFELMVAAQVRPNHQRADPPELPHS